jgi:predicted phosphodiesterase
VDSILLNLPPSRRLALQGVQIEMLHVLPGSQSDLVKWAKARGLDEEQSARKEAFEKSFDGSTRLVIFGHSHEPCLAPLGGRLFFNPGSAGKQRFSLPRCCGLLEITPRELRATIVPLGRYNIDVPGEVRLSLGG